LQLPFYRCLNANEQLPLKFICGLVQICDATFARYRCNLLPHISTEEIMFHPAFICLSVCQQLRVKVNDRIFVKISPETYLWTRKFPLSFGSHLPMDQFRNFSKDSSTLHDAWHFSQFGSSLWQMHYSD